MNSTMFRALTMRAKGVYKNVALASNGGSVVLNSGSVGNSSSISNILKGNREISYLNISTDGVALNSSPTDIEFTLDFGAIKKISELNFCHGYAVGNVSSNTANSLSPSSNQIPNTLVVSYSANGTTFTTLSSGLYSINYLFSKNILASSLNARYIKLKFNGYDVLISGVEAWGLN